jgi:hypothetical protein
VTSVLFAAGLLLGQATEQPSSPAQPVSPKSPKQTLIAEWTFTLEDPSGPFIIEFPPAPPTELFPWADSKQVLLAAGSKGETLHKNWVYSERKIKVDGATFVCPRLTSGSRVWWGAKPEKATIRLIRELVFHEAIDRPVPSGATFDGQRSLMGLPIPSWAPRLSGSAQLDAVFGGMLKRNGQRAWQYVPDNAISEFTLENVRTPTDCDGSALRMTAALRAGGICSYPVACRTPRDWHATAVYHYGGEARMMDAEVLLNSKEPRPIMVMEGTVPFGIYVPVHLEMEVPKWVYTVTNKRGVIKRSDVLGKGPIAIIIGGVKGLTQHPSLHPGRTMDQSLPTGWEKFVFPQPKASRSENPKSPAAASGTGP